MAVEQLMQSVLSASPAMRRKLEAVLNGKDTQPNNGTKDARLISVSATAKMLAVSRGTVYRLLKQKRLDHIMLTGVPRITMRSISEFLDGKRPENEITAEMIEASKARYQASRAREAK